MCIRDSNQGLRVVGTYFNHDHTHTSLKGARMNARSIADGAKIGVIKSEEEFYSILYAKYKAYLYKVPSMKRMIKVTGARINSKEDLKNHMEAIKIYVRGHNLYDIFYGRYKGCLLYTSRCV